MAKDLTQSRLDRQNILNNELAIQEIQETSVVEAVFFEDRLLMTKEMVASFFEVDIQDILCIWNCNKVINPYIPYE